MFLDGVQQGIIQTLTGNRMGNWVFKGEVKQTHSTIFSQSKRILSVHLSEPETSGGTSEVPDLISKGQKVVVYPQEEHGSHK